MKNGTTRMRTLPHPYTKGYDSVREGLCNPSTWADEVTIKHASRELNANILFLDIERQKFYCGVHNAEVLKSGKRGASQNSRQPTVIVHWCNHVHFEPLARLCDVGALTTKVQMAFWPEDSAEDAAIVNAIMRTYAKECAL